MGLLGLAAVLAPVVGLALAIKALIDNRRLRGQLEMLAARLASVEARGVRPAPETGPALDAGPVPYTPAAPVATAPPSRIIEDTAGPEPVSEPPGSDVPPPIAAPAPVASGGAGGRWLEKVLVENWLVWLGGVTLVFGGAFLVKVSIDYGLLTPIVRVVLAVLLGFSLSAAAEWVARREAGDGPSYVSQSLAAAGSATVFAALFAAHQLYGLLPAPLAFPLLAGTAVATAAISLRHGPLVAALGLPGAYAVPLLVQSGEPHALPLFAYLTVVSAAALALLRFRAWWWLAWITLGGALFWVLLWLAASNDRNLPVVTGFLLLHLVLYAGFRLGVPRVAALAGRAESAVVRVLTRTAFWAIAAVLFIIVHADDFGTVGLTGAALATLFFLWFACRDDSFDDVIAIAAALSLAVLSSWDLPWPTEAVESVFRPVPPEQISRFCLAALATAAVLGNTFWLLPRVARPGRWAALSALAPIVVLAIAYSRLQLFDLDIGWSMLALALAGVELAAASAVAKRREAAGSLYDPALAFYAVGVLGATILAATFALSKAWLTVALALHLPALGWVEGRIRVPALRRMALGVAAAVLIRLVLNPAVMAYPLSEAPLVNWLLYGYGIPALAFIIATRQFGSRANDLLVPVLEAGSIVFTFLLLTLELRHLFYARLDAPLQSLAKDSVLTLVWLALAALLFRLAARRSRPVLEIGGILIFAIATAQAVLWQGIIANPLLTGDPVGRLIIIDVLTLAYAAPALLYGVIASLRLGPPPVQWIARAATVGFGFLWLTLEIRHFFRGEVLSWGEVGQTEWYAYSTAWLLMAVLLLAISLIRRQEALRRVALAGIALVVAKVFLSDMAILEGVLRALSFLALGAALIGIGYAYRRLRPLQP